MTTFEQFAFQTPLYTKMYLPDDLLLKATLIGRRPTKVDGHCPMCGQSTTFSCSSVSTWNLQVTDNANKVREADGYRSLYLSCARDRDHKIHYWFLLENDTVEKVGQDPSLADIANDEAATYRNVLSKKDAMELHKAIGLAAHGVGIGSFVYLRRIFERLIYGRFHSFRETEGWVEEDFRKLRMDEKVKFLKGHIPTFLYEHRELYSILSKGIHELSEKDCLAVFEPIKLSLKIILDEDKKKQEELELHRQASAAIKAIKHSNA